MAEEKKVTIKVAHNRKLVYLPGLNAVSFVSGTKSSTTSGAKQTNPVNNSLVTHDDIVPWGNDNLFPQNVICDVNWDPLMPTMLKNMAKALYGSRLDIGYVEDYRDDGSEIFRPVFYRPWEEFKRRSPWRRYRLETANDFVWFANFFTDVVLTKDRKEVWSLNVFESAQCRFMPMNKDGIIENVIVNGNWRDRDKKLDLKFPTIDPYNNPVKTLKDRGEGHRFIFHSSYPSPDCSYYQLVSWNSIRTSGWLKYAKKLPEISNNIAENLLQAGYIVEVADWYWKDKYKNWDDMTEAEQDTCVTESYQAFSDYTSGTDEAGKALYIPAKTLENGTSYEAFPGWVIKPFPRAEINKDLIDKSGVANQYIAYASGFDSSIISALPGSTSSGSDKRVAFNIYVSLLEPDKDIVLEPLYFVKEYNGWDEELEFRIRYPMITTLDKGKEVQQQSS